jgi:hypothetical protein
MTGTQAIEVLRATARHALDMAPYIYGLTHKDAAAALINEALIVNAAEIEAHKAGSDHGQG